MFIPFVFHANKFKYIRKYSFLMKYESLGFFSKLMELAAMTPWRGSFGPQAVCLAPLV